jgi:small redox-active disulfide protein 2
MNIKILGSGCPRCIQLYDAVKKAADEMGLDYTIEKVTDMNKIMEYGVVMTPALIVDEEVKLAGKVASVNAAKKYLQK